MSWHNGNKWRGFEARQEKQAAAWRRAGMTEEQIAAMKAFDAAVLRSDRRFYVHNQPLLISGLDPEAAPEEPAPEADGMPAGVRLGWLEEIEDPTLQSLLLAQTPETLAVIELHVFRGRSFTEIARTLGCTRQNVSSFWRRFAAAAREALGDRYGEG